MTMTTEPMIRRASSLTAADRCDRCGARAYMRAEMIAGDLLFCAHHAREHRDVIREVAVSVTDETERLAHPSRDTTAEGH